MSKVFMLIKAMSEILFFIIISFYILVFILSLDGGGEMSAFNVLAVLYGNGFWVVLLIMSLAGSTGIFVFMRKKHLLTGDVVKVIVISFIVSTGAFVIAFLKASFVFDWLYHIYVNIFLDGNYPASDKALYIFPFLFRTLFLFLFIGVLLSGVSFLLYKKYRLKRLYKVSL